MSKDEPRAWNVEEGTAYANSAFRLGTDIATGKAVAVVANGKDAGQAMPLSRDGKFAALLMYACQQETGRALNTRTVSEIVEQAKMLARVSGFRRYIARRVCRHKDSVIVDLGPSARETDHAQDLTDRYVRISPSGVCRMETPPEEVSFYRGPLFAPLPDFDMSTSWHDAVAMFRYMPMDSGLVPLMMAYATAVWALCDTQVPLLMVTGKPGQGKSYICDTLLWLLDPVLSGSPDSDVSPGIAMPDKEDDLAVSAQDGLVLYIDNMSRATRSMSDLITGLATGRTWKKRTLYTNDGVSMIPMLHPTLLNGVDPTGLQPDVARRLIHIETSDGDEPDDRRKGETMEEWRLRHWGATVSGLMNLTSQALSQLDRVSDASGQFPRWRRWLRACDLVMGTDAYGTYESLLYGEVKDSVFDNPVGLLMLEHARQFKEARELTISEIMDLMGESRGKSGNGTCPRSPKEFGRQLQMCMSSLQERGWRIQKAPRTSGRRPWIIQAPDESGPADARMGGEGQ